MNSEQIIFQSVVEDTRGVSLLCSQGGLPGGGMPELLLKEWGVNKERNSKGIQGQGLV